jgi:DNA-binding transcriptional MerR regulator
VSKGPEAFRTISEVAEELDLPQHVLRFWETRFAQIKPLKRGGGRRYYRPDDIDLLRGIRQLLYGEGYTIRGVQRILHEQGPRFVVSAGKGEPAGLPTHGVNGHSETERRDPPPLSLGLAHVREADEANEPVFEPSERHGPGNERRNGSGLPLRDRLTPDEVERLRATLAELLELKRLLDQAR